MRSLDMPFDQVTASPAARVKETLESVETGYGAPLEPHFDRRIYLASAETLLDVIHDTPDNADTLLLVGHNPGLEELVLLLVHDREEDGERDKEIGRAHVWTPVTNAHLVCPLLLEKNNIDDRHSIHNKR